VGANGIKLAYLEQIFPLKPDLMKKLLFLLLFISFSILMIQDCSQPGKTRINGQPVNLRCEYLNNPIGIDTMIPRFSWELSGEERSLYQSAFQLLVATSPEILDRDKADVWNSGRVKSTENIQVEYDGKSLSSSTRYYWKVRTWNRKGRVTQYSETAWFETALLDPADWKAEWIGDGMKAPESEADMYLDNPNPLLRKEFRVEKKIKSARLYITGLGYYEAYLNGNKAGDHLLDPGWTNYAKRIQYVAYDVTEMLQEGDNAIGVILGNGWYNPLPLYLFNRLNLRNVLTTGQPRALVQLMIRYNDDTNEVIVSNESWKAGKGPILMNSVYLGEKYDARLEQDGWNKPGFDDSSWITAVKAESPGGRLVTENQPPIRITRIIKPVSITEPHKGVFIFDMGQNFAGCARIKVKGPAGTEIQLRYGELLNEDGTLNDRTTIACHIMEGWYYQQREGHPRNARQIDTYIMKGSGEEIYNPRFTFHGFRYIEVTGFPGKPTLETLEGLRMNSDLPVAGEFECSNTLFNKIQENVEWTFLSNVFSVESDCPGREKFGYGGDMVTACEAYISNYDMSGFYTKAVRDFHDDQHPSGGMPECAPYNGINDGGLTEDTGPIGWMLAFPFLQDRLYRYYGDKRLLEEQYENTVRLIEFIRQNAPDNTLGKGISDHESLAPKPTGITSTSFYYHHVLMLSEFAGILNKSGDQKKYAALADEIKKAFIEKFVKEGTGKVDAETQASQVFALYYDLLPESDRNAALEILEKDILEKNNGHLSTGIFGTKMMYDVFRMYERNDLGFTITNQRTFPGYGYMIEKGGTTIWESWAGGGISYNHPMFGSVSDWFFKALGGIYPSENAVGFNPFIIKPSVVGDLEWVDCQYQSIRGKIISNWHIENNIFYLDASVPGNTTARIFIPAAGKEFVFESDIPATDAHGIKFIQFKNNYAEFEAGSGLYHFSSALK
jgi:alpha-L-rhamnosidase